MEVIYGVQFTALRGRTLFTELLKWFEERGLSVIKAYVNEDPSQSFSNKDELFIRATNFGYRIDINPTHQITAFVTRYPFDESGITSFTVEAKKIRKTRSTKPTRK